MGNTPLKREIAGIALLLFALFLAGAVIAPPGVAAGASCTTARGVFGPIGACLRSGLLQSIGVPAALLLPLAPAAHALRLFGRMESDTDRSWLVFLVGVVVILPVALGLARGAQPPEIDPAAGIWGGFAAYYAQRGFGTVGAWLTLALATSALAAATLRWNPIRALVGPAPSGIGRGESGIATPQLVAAEPEKPRRKRSKKDEFPAGTPADVATTLAPTPEEMPAIDPSFMRDAAADKADIDDEDGLPIRDRRKKERKSKSDVAAEHA